MKRSLPSRIRGKYHRLVAEHLGRRNWRLANREPLISFTFDDFPSSALHVGGKLLERFGAVGTYYVSLGLAGQDSPTGPIMTVADLHAALQRGHELGCHTFSHCDAALTPVDQFARSIAENTKAMAVIDRSVRFESFSYPIGVPSAAAKRQAGRLFRACRGGGQTHNQGTVDLNYLRALFLEQCGGDREIIRQAIELNRAHNGWLIFATHDVAPAPTRFGCTPDFFAWTVECAVDSGAKLLPVSAALSAAGVP